MNFVAGALLICEVDPTIQHYSTSQQGAIDMIQKTVVYPLFPPFYS